jgi:hypothetical protein
VGEGGNGYKGRAGLSRREGGKSKIVGSKRRREGLMEGDKKIGEGRTGVVQ